MRIEETVTRGYRTCGADRLAAGHCEGYNSAEIDVVRQVTSITFADSGSPSSDPYAPLISHQHERLRPVDPADLKCPHCHAPTNISLEARPAYRRLSEHSPDALVAKAAAERAADQRAADSLSADERSARALERLAGSAVGSNELRELREELQQLRALMAPGNGNGHAAEPEADPAAPATRPRKPKAEP